MPRPPDSHGVGIGLCPELQQQAFLKRARTHTARIERLHDGERVRQVGDVRARRGGKLGEVLTQIPVRIEVPDEPVGKGQHAGVVRPHAELVAEMLAERVAGRWQPIHLVGPEQTISSNPGDLLVAGYVPARDPPQ